MHATELDEARIEEANHLLVAPPALRDDASVEGFFGTVTTPEEIGSGTAALAGKTVYLCGDISAVRRSRLDAADRVLVVRELSYGYDGSAGEGAREPWPVVGLGRLPLRVHGLGLYYRRYFDPDADYFGRISGEHVFQSLTESTKPGTARRSGIYLTPVTRDGEERHFRLLRCSTNLSGPTENFRPTDTHIVEELNREAATVFRNHAPLNHVLAQIYHNASATPERKQSKAKISSHADKTKDMPANGVMAFCTFYDGLDALHPSSTDPFDRGVKGVSALTRLRFRLKDPAAERAGAPLPPQFGITLHPGSVFFMPLSTNRLYTHEVRPSALNAEQLPTRLGYVVRCSSAEAVHKDGRTYLKKSGDLVELGPPTQDGMDELRRLYAEENRTTSFIDYGDAFLFSMNTGDYVAPAL
ncbi:hypothetical protein ACIF6K_22850 [Streptomyces sp. NPDC085942]|uniref:hypothetical protein n=1 Tax=Streptomyces sp. NPDC085942 TaxID=3365743 RepID=UPI0037D4BB2D